MNNDKEPKTLYGAQVVKGGKLEKYVLMPIIVMTMFYLAISALFIEAPEYFGYSHLAYRKAYHHYPLLVCFSYFSFFLLRIGLKTKIINKIIPNLSEEQKVLRLTWDMVITALCFVLLQMKIFELLDIKF